MKFKIHHKYILSKTTQRIFGAQQNISKLFRIRRKSKSFGCCKSKCSNEKTFQFEKI